MSQRDWVLDHIRRYQETDGEDGHSWSGRDGKQNLFCLLLTTTGHRTGKARTTPLIYGEHDGRYIIVASRGGASEHPSWYDNLAAAPNVQIQVGAELFPAIATTAAGEERAELWKMMAAIFPSYDEYQKKAKDNREIPVVILQRA